MSINTVLSSWKPITPTCAKSIIFIQFYTPNKHFVFAKKKVAHKSCGGEEEFGNAQKNEYFFGGKGGGGASLMREKQQPYKF